MRVRIRWIDKKTCAVTLIPGRLARWFGAETRVGIAYRSYEVIFRWKTTDRYVGWRVMRAIETAPVHDMTVEQLDARLVDLFLGDPKQLLLDDPSKPG